MISVFKFLRTLGVAALLGPVIYSVYLFLKEIERFSIHQVLLDLTGVILQSALSASLSVALGVLACASVISLKKGQKFHLYFGLIPQFLPTLLMIFAYVKVFSFLQIFPQGYWHVVILHTLINIGLVSFLAFYPLQEALQKKMHLYATLNLSAWKYLRLLGLSEMRAPLVYIWVLVFSYCLSSFSIPLILAGSRFATSLEQLIYQNGFIEGSWSVAAFWGLLQVVFVALLFRSKLFSTSEKSYVSVHCWKIRFPGYFFSAIASALLVFSLMIFSPELLLQAWTHIRLELKPVFINTSLLVLWTLFFYSLYFWSQVLLIRQELYWKFYQKFWSLSPILLGVYMLSLSTHLSLNQNMRLILTALVLAAFIYPLTFKFWLWPKIKNIQTIRMKSDVLGLSEQKSIDSVLIMYFVPIFIWSLSYVFLFVLGDFAISSILLSDTPTLGLSIKNYIFRYQLAEAQILSLGLLVIALSVLMISGGKRVLHSKF